VQEYLKGFIAGISSFSPYINGGIGISQFDLSLDRDLDTEIHDSLSMMGWDVSGILPMRSHYKNEVIENIKKLFQGALPGTDVSAAAETLISIIDQEHGRKYQLFSHLFAKDNDGRTLLIVFETANERVLLNVGWCYD